MDSRWAIQYAGEIKAILSFGFKTMAEQSFTFLH